MPMKKAFVISAAILFIAVMAGFVAFRYRGEKAGFNHLAIHVSDLQQSRDFYGNVIGLDSIPNPVNDGRRTWYRISEHGQLHIIAGAQRTAHDKNTHLCFSVSSINDFIPVLKKRNIPFESWTGEKATVTKRADGVQQIYFQDPDGYWIEMNDDQF